MEIPTGVLDGDSALVNVFPEAPDWLGCDVGQSFSYDRLPSPSAANANANAWVQVVIRFSMIRNYFNAIC